MNGKEDFNWDPMAQQLVGHEHVLALLVWLSVETNNIFFFKVVKKSYSELINSFNTF